MRQKQVQQAVQNVTQAKERYMSGKRVTIKEVAAEANVTAQTVSRVLRNTGYVAADTYNKVIEAVKRLNYVPNRMAASLRVGKSKSIAVVFDSLRNFYFAIMVDYIQREVQNRGYTLQTIFANSHTITEDIYRDALSLGVSAVISFLEADPEVVKVVKSFDVPLLIFGRRTSYPEIDYVTTDDVQGGRLVAERFIQRGCKTFLYASEAFGMTCMQDRHTGFAEVLAQHGYKSDVIDCAGGVKPAFTEYIQKHGAPSAVFCLSDMIAYEILNILKRLNISDTLVIGYDDISSDMTMPVELTSVGIDKYQHVSYVVSKIIAKAENLYHGRIAEKVSVRLHIGETA